MNKRILTLFLSLTLLLSLAACGTKTDASRRDTNEIVVGIAQDLENSLDPYTSVTAANRFAPSRALPSPVCPAVPAPFAPPGETAAPIPSAGPAAASTMRMSMFPAAS